MSKAIGFLRRIAAASVVLSTVGWTTGVDAGAAPKAPKKVTKAAAAASTPYLGAVVPARAPASVRPGSKNMINPQPLPPKVVQQR